MNFEMIVKANAKRFVMKESRCLGEFMDPSLAASSQRTAELVKQLNILGGDEFPEKCWQLVTAMHGGLVGTL